MALNQLGMGLTFTVVDQASALMAKIRGGFQSTSSAAGVMGSKVAKSSNLANAAIAGMAAGAGTAGLAMAGKAAGLFGQFEQGLNKVGAISNASEADLKSLGEAAIQAGLDTQFSPIEATEGLGNLAQMGFNAQEQLNLLGPSLDLAAGGAISIAQGASTAGAAIKAFSLSGDEAIGVSDKLLRITQLSSLAAGELELALGTVARGSGATNQSLSEMLPAMGLVRDTGVQASVAASSVSSALLMIAKNGEKFGKLGVDVTDSTGKFRPFLDIVNETSGALEAKFPDAAERAAASMDLFGKFGLTAANAIGTKLKNGIKDNNGEMVKGAAAIELMRSRMEDSAGTAAKFRDALLDNLEGQKTLLRGSVETLGVVAGEPLSAAIRPLVAGLTGGLNSVIKLIQSMPAGLKNFIASALLMGSTILAVVGSLAAAKIAMAALGVTMGAVGSAVGSAMLAVAPFVAVLLLAIGVAQAFRIAYEDNLGGFADLVDRTIGKAKTIVAGIRSFMADGVISGDILNKGNEGLLGFVSTVAVVVTKVRAFFEGLAVGTAKAFEGLGPSFGAMVDALKRVGAAFGFLGDKPEGVASGIRDAAAAGAVFGRIVGAAVEVVIGVITAGANIVTGFASKWDLITQALAPVSAAFSEVGGIVDDLIAQLGLGAAEGEATAGVFETVGAIIGAVIALAASVVGGAMGGIVTAFRAATNVISGVVNIIGGIFTGDWQRVWDGAKQVVFGMVQGVLSILETMVGAVAGLVDTLGAVTGKDLGLKVGVQKLRTEIEASLKPAGVAVSTGSAPAPPAPPPPALQSLPPAFSASAAIAGPAAPAIDAGALGAMAAAAARASAAGQPPLVSNATLTVDGATLGEIVTKYARDGSGRDGSDVDIL